jgi:DNA-directed RNA polymerase subunit omega
MGRVTIENCLDKVSSHFDLIIVASERAKQISAGKKSDISKKGIKTHVTALREIEKNSVDVNKLKESVIYKLHNSQAVLDILDDNKSEDDYSIIEELQSSAFVSGELEEIDSETLFEDIETIDK